MSEFHLKTGSKIGVMAPSSFVEQADVEASVGYFKRNGFEVFIHPQTFARYHQSAGTTTEKLEALHALYADKSIDAIWAAGGGNRALYLLDALDFDLIAKHPKPLIGFSDVTVLLNPIYAHAGVQGWHAQSFKRMHDFAGADETLDVLTGKMRSMSLNDCDVVSGGQVEGVLIGGCLSLFHYLPGTNDCPNLQGAILYLEDTGDEMSRFDRMFAQMKRMGVFEQIGGLVLGEFHYIGDNPARPFGFSFADVIAECLDGRDIPVAIGAPFGHGEKLFPLPIGGRGVLDLEKKILTF